MMTKHKQQAAADGQARRCFCYLAVCMGAKKKGVAIMCPTLLPMCVALCHIDCLAHKFVVSDRECCIL
eukprot:7507676-Prorocentrum_lima.AAC.1